MIGHRRRAAGRRGRGVLVLLLFLATAASPAPRVLDDFSMGLDPAWREKAFRGRTRYSVVRMDGNACLKAESRAAASGLVYRIRYRLGDYPWLGWRWRVEGTVAGGDALRREGDDYAARIYVVFPHWIPTRTRSINYIWANKLRRGERVPNAYYAGAVMIAVESGPGRAGRWVREARNVYQDYRDAFGEEPPPVGAVAVMTDTDDTGGSAVAYYDDLVLLPEAPADLTRLEAGGRVEPDGRPRAAPGQGE